MFKRLFYAVCLFVMSSQLNAMESITGSDSNYLQICKKAAVSSYYFHNFRSLPQYAAVVEFFDGGRFADYIQGGSNDLLQKLETFRKLDSLGNPAVQSYSHVGKFSATTLRYIVVADHIREIFNLPAQAKIVEIGGGFGGQCYILSQLKSFSKYYIYDLPPVISLMQKVLGSLSVPNVLYVPAEDALPEENVDLLISNYAFSECARDTQLDYFERVIKKADRGYIIYNQISKPYFGIDSLSPREFYELLDSNDMNPAVYEELISTHHDNILFVWDRTRS